MNKEMLLAKWGVNITPQDLVIETPVVEKPNFHHNRTGFFTASEMHKLFTSKLAQSTGETAKGYIFEKAFEKIEGIPAKQEVKAAAMDWGNTYECEAIEDYMTFTGYELTNFGDDQQSYIHPTLDVSARPDAEVMELFRGVEAKCPANGGIHLRNLMCGDNLEAFKTLRWEYWIQMQVQMWCMGSNSGDFYSYRPDAQKIPKRYLLNVPRDQAFIEKMEQVVIEAIEQRDEIISQILKNP